MISIPGQRSRGYVLLAVATTLLVVATLVLILFAQLQQIDQSLRSQQDRQALEYALEAGYAHNRRVLLDNDQCNSYVATPGTIDGITYTATLNRTSGPTVNLTVTAKDADGGQLVREFLLNQYETVNSVQLTSEADTHIEEDLANHNHGNDSRIKVEANTINEAIHGLIRFDHSAVPTTARVELATLRLTVQGNQGEDNDPDSVYRVIWGWTESGATWDKRDSGALSYWISPGGDYNTRVWGQFPNSQVGLQIADVTRLVQLEVANNGSAGFLIRSEPHALSVEKRYHSREAPGVADRPRLDIDYRCLCGTGC